MTAGLDEPFELKGDRAAFHTTFRKTLAYCDDVDAVFIKKLLDGDLKLADLGLAFRIGEHKPRDRSLGELKIVRMSVENDETCFVFVEIDPADPHTH